MIHWRNYRLVIFSMSLAVLVLVVSGGRTLEEERLEGAKSAHHGHYGHRGHYGGYGGHKHGHHHKHYNPCGNIYAEKGFCHHKHAGHYAHHNSRCYIQCDDWGRGFVRPCAKGTFWRGGKGPTKYNKCVGRNHHHKGHHSYAARDYGGRDYGGRNYGGYGGRGGYGFGGYGYDGY